MDVGDIRNQAKVAYEPAEILVRTRLPFECIPIDAVAISDGSENILERRGILVHVREEVNLNRLSD